MAMRRGRNRPRRFIPDKKRLLSRGRTTIGLKGREMVDPCQVVQGQLDAYNARDIDAFMSHWADDAQYFAHPAELLASGAAQIRERHLARFKEPNLHGQLIHRMTVGNLVVDHELVSRTFPEGQGHVEVIAIYEVDGGKIAKAWFKIGKPMLDQTL
jgi:hypothetical protein